MLGLRMKESFLGDYDGNRENNFTTIRLFFAWAVLYGHSYAIQGEGGVRDPLNLIFKGSVWIGALSVDGFFAISGFLVTASILNRNLLDYTLSRILRIYPALIVCVLISVFVLGPFLTHLAFSEYFGSERVYKYLRNALAFEKMQWTLPGVFEENRRNAFNGSLWSLTVEVRCYLLLALAYMFGLLRNRVIANFTIAALIFLAQDYFKHFPLIGTGNKNWFRTTEFFLIGVAFYINRKDIPLDWKLGVLAFILAISSFGEEWFKWVFPISFIYLIFCVAYGVKQLPTDRLLGDISYGLYIYAWPVQQCVNLLFPHLSPIGNTIISTGLTGLIGWMSWNYIEKPTLKYKKFVNQRLLISRLLARKSQKIID